MKAAFDRVAALVGRVIAWVERTKPARVWNRYLRARGPLLAQGLSFQAIFAVFAALWVAFAIAGFVVRGDPALQAAIVEVLARAFPGLIDTGDGDGAVTLDALLSATILGWTGALAAVGLVGTALGWLASARTAVRAIFGLADATGNPILRTLIDLATAAGLAAALLVSAALTVASADALGWAFGVAGIGAHTTIGLLVSRATGVAITFVVDAIVLVLLYRVLAGIPIPLRLLAPGVAVGAAALGVLKLLGTLLLGGATANPLLVSFAVILGLLIWFSLLCQVLLVVASWIAETAAARGVDLSGRRRPGHRVGEDPSRVSARRRPMRPRTRPGRVARAD